MRFVHHTMVTAALTLGVVMSSAVGQSNQPLQSPDKARAILKRSAKAYREVPALTDVMRLQSESPTGKESGTVDLAFGPGGAMRMKVNDMILTAHDDSLYVVSENITSKYFKMAIENNIVQTLTQLTGSRANVPIPVILRTDFSLQKDLGTLTVGRLRNPKVQGVGTIKKDGRTQHRVVLDAENGTGEIHVDAKTNLLSRIEFNATLGGSGGTVNGRIDFDPKPKKQLDEPIHFDSSTRRQVDSLRELTRISAGDTAPPFELQTLGGRNIDMKDLAGQVVVLDFWATWCGPCKRGLPLLDKFHQWVNDREKAVHVYAVNTMERHDDREAIRKNVKAYWQRAEFSVPTLMDYDQNLIRRYGYTSIPTTVVIGPDGTVEAVHNGFLPTMLETLKKDVNRILEKQS